MKKLPKASVEHSFAYQGTEAFFEALPLAALLVDAQHHIVRANQVAEPLASGWRTAPLSLTFGALHPLNIALTRALTEQRTSHLHHITLDGSEAIAWVAPYGLDHALVVLDVATKKEPENYTKLSATMAAMLAHEIRNPLLSIKGAAQLLKSAVAGEDQSLCDLIGKEVDRLEQLIATLDPLSRAPQRDMLALNIHEVLEHARMAVAASFPAITFVLDYDPSLPEIRGNRDALVQALLNLLKNAAESVTQVDQPTITISSRYVMGETRRNAEGKILCVAISITDNGCGIAPELEGRVFAPFTTTKTGGKGLGLAVVASITEEHKGLIAYDTASGGGARFTLYLPIA